MQTSRILPIRNQVPILMQFWKLNCIAEGWVALSILNFDSENILKGLNCLLWLEESLAIPADKENPRRYFNHNRKPIAIQIFIYYLFMAIIRNLDFKFVLIFDFFFLWIREREKGKTGSVIFQLRYCNPLCNI